MDVSNSANGVNLRFTICIELLRGVHRSSLYAAKITLELYYSNTPNTLKSKMSYREFERGQIAEEVRKSKLAARAEHSAIVELAKWHESERILNILRTTKAKDEQSSEGQ